MKHSHWIRQYHNEQNQIHMPNLCRESILNIIEQDSSSEKGTETRWESVRTPAKRYHWKWIAAALIVLILAGLAAALAIGTRKPASNVVEVENLQIFASTAPANEVSRDDYAERNVSKSLIFYRCLNTVQYLKQLSGTVTTHSHAEPDIVRKGTFSFDFEQDQYYAIVDALDAVDQETIHSTNTYYNNLGQLVAIYDQYDEGERFFTTQSDELAAQESWNAKQNIMTDAEIDGLTEQDILEMKRSSDPTGVSELTACFFPQELTLEYLRDFDNWEIIDIFQNVVFENCADETLYRTVVQISGFTNPESSSASDVDSFSILVDLKTGIWFWYEGDDADGIVQDYLYTEDLQFYENGEELYVPTFSEELDEELANNYTYVENVYTYGENTNHQSTDSHTEKEAQ